MKKITVLSLGFTMITLVSCKQEAAKALIQTESVKVIERHEPKEVSYTLETPQIGLLKIRTIIPVCRLPMQL
jgi:hypothetical protein